MNHKKRQQAERRRKRRDKRLIRLRRLLKGGRVMKPDPLAVLAYDLTSAYLKLQEGGLKVEKVVIPSHFMCECGRMKVQATVNAGADVGQWVCVYCGSK